MKVSRIGEQYFEYIDESSYPTLLTALQSLVKGGQIIVRFPAGTRVSAAKQLIERLNRDPQFKGLTTTIGAQRSELFDGDEAPNVIISRSQ